MEMLCELGGGELVDVFVNDLVGLVVVVEDGVEEVGFVVVVGFLVFEVFVVVVVEIGGVEGGVVEDEEIDVVGGVGEFVECF